MMPSRRAVDVTRCTGRYDCPDKGAGPGNYRRTDKRPVRIRGARAVAEDGIGTAISIVYDLISY